MAIRNFGCCFGWIARNICGNARRNSEPTNVSSGRSEKGLEKPCVCLSYDSSQNLTQTTLSTAIPWYVCKVRNLVLVFLGLLVLNPRPIQKMACNVISPLVLIRLRARKRLEPDGEIRKERFRDFLSNSEPLRNPVIGVYCAQPLFEKALRRRGGTCNRYYLEIIPSKINKRRHEGAFRFDGF